MNSRTSRPLHVIEPGRLMRGARLPVRRLGAGEYVVAGSHAPWYVNLNADVPCDCEDAQYRGVERVGPCKHELAARLQERDPMTVYSLALMLEQRMIAHGMPGEEN